MMRLLLSLTLVLLLFGACGATSLSTWCLCIAQLTCGMRLFADECTWDGTGICLFVDARLGHAAFGCGPMWDMCLLLGCPKRHVCACCVVMPCWGALSLVLDRVCGTHVERDGHVDILEACPVFNIMVFLSNLIAVLLKVVTHSSHTFLLFILPFMRDKLQEDERLHIFSKRHAFMSLDSTLKQLLEIEGIEECMDATNKKQVEEIKEAAEHEAEQCEYFKAAVCDFKKHSSATSQRSKTGHVDAVKSNVFPTTMP